MLITTAQAPINQIAMLPTDRKTPNADEALPEKYGFADSMEVFFTVYYKDLKPTQYLPSAIGYEHGAYETFNCRFVAGSGEKFADEMVRLLKSCKEKGL